ncbi:MAG: immune inhibitor A [Methanomassiliicoccales archaeon]
MLRNITKILSIVIVLAMVLGAFAVMSPALSAPSAPAAKMEAKFAEPERMYASEEYRYQKLDLNDVSYELSAINANALAAPGNIYANGSIARYYVGTYGKWAYNETGATGYMLFQKRGESRNCELWTALDMTFPDGDPRNAYVSRITINDSQAQYMIDHFETNIYPKMTNFFGEQPMIDGENSWFKAQGRPYFGTNVSGRVMIMVFNIVDESFFNSEYPSYIAGYFSSTMDALYDRNIIHIDCWDWANRTTANSSRPWVYESTIAHEYQHLLHDYFNPDQISFVNEGCSMFAEIVCGYGLDMAYVDRFFYTPDNSLVDWGDQGQINILADYGAAALFTTYLADHFGPEMVQVIVHAAGTTGIDTINYAFGEIGAKGWNFDKAFNYWRLANLILKDTPGNGWFNYKSIDLSSSSGPRVYDWWPSGGDVYSGGMFFGATATYEGYTTGIRNLGAYGTDYVYVNPSMILQPTDGPSITPPWWYGLYPYDLKFRFKGDVQTAKGWQMTQVPIGVNDEIYYENFNRGGSWPHGWSRQTVGVYGGGPWHMATYGGGNYFAEVYGPGYSLIPSYQYERLYTSYINLWDYTKAQLSFDLTFEMGTPYDFCRVRYSLNGGPFQTLALWDHDVSETFTMDASDLTGFLVQLRFDFVTYGGNSYMAIDNLAFSDLITTTGWWSDKGDLVDYSLYTELDLTEMEQAILTLDTAWDIEPYWDFGFVQVSTDGESWTSVANEYTTIEYDPSAMEEIVENLPGLTGSSGGYVLASFDLSEWAGQVVMVRLRYMTDWASSMGGWYVKGAYLNGETIPMDAWESDTPAQLNHWLVTLYMPGCVGYNSKVWMLPIITTLSMEEVTQSVIRHMGAFLEYREMYIIISPTAGNADYSMGFFNEMGYA